MTLYRLDYLDARDKVFGAVKGLDIDVLTIGSSGDILTQHMTKAREYAAEAARRAKCDVQIAGIIKGGIIKPRLVAKPDGTFKRPTGTQLGDCKAGKNEGACFCFNCRAGRRAR